MLTGRLIFGVFLVFEPPIEEFSRRARAHRHVPVWRDVPADLETPVSTWLKLRRIGASFLLESAEGPESVGRYSIIGVRAFGTVRVRGRRALIEGLGGALEPVERELPPEGTPTDLVRDLLADFDVAPEPSLPRFFGGAVGFFSYDLIRAFERLPDAPPDDLDLPDAWFIFTRSVVIFDHLRKTCRLVTLADGGEQYLAREDAELASIRGDAEAELRHIVDALREPLNSPPTGGHGPPVSSTNFEQPAFESAVQRIQDYIRAGDAFQVVLSRRVTAETDVPPFSVYRALRMMNPSPYMFFLELGDLALVGASPEMLVKLEDGICTTRPIAGTRPRGSDAAEDQLLARSLLADPKERAEHVMLVDLGRNDLGRVSRAGSVRVRHMMEVENFSHVMHMTSTVEGVLEDGCDAFDLLRAAFPAGTVSGAPKVRAMEIIDELETERRGPYAGAVGYVAYNGNLDTCIAIRTVVCTPGKLHFQAGAGIVADSDPAAEFRETEAKLCAGLRALELGVDGFDL